MSEISMGKSAAQVRKYCAHCECWGGPRDFRPNKTIAYEKTSEGKCFCSGAPYFSTVAKATASCTKFKLWSILK